MEQLYIERQKEMLLKSTLPTGGDPGLSGRQPEPSYITPSPVAISPALHYPVGCLVFVKNLNQDTNKTVLRSLLASAFSTESPDCIDYVDYTKGLDSVSQRALETPKTA
jgi:hypothetical protein